MRDSIVFEDWGSVLNASVAPAKRRVYREAIVKFRYWLRETGKPARIRREVLRWYYKTGLERMGQEAASGEVVAKERSLRSAEIKSRGDYRLYDMNDVPTAFTLKMTALARSICSGARLCSVPKVYDAFRMGLFAFAQISNHSIKIIAMLFCEGITIAPDL